ncbi:MAG: lipocalin family protein [Desulfobacterales bacterium]|nr:lipocalin family protein [Desulfobacterales bacterium]MDD4071920.1 lipocalin family protein [Desulfobacterales bacterium]MDD4393922.1 lipocalin family protein [Desulfobacterales bacterium]
MIRSLFFFIPIIISGCAGIPANVSLVTGFDIDRYLGTWYEIARLDHSFERGLERVTAEYSLRDDGGINVVNRGFDPEKDKWKEAVGKAYFVGDSDTGRLKVSFWGPFYGGYNIIALDKKNYSYSLVCGPSRSYLWILAREPRMEEFLKSELIKKAKTLGFETGKMIHVTH